MKVGIKNITRLSEGDEDRFPEAESRDSVSARYEGGLAVLEKSDPTTSSGVVNKQQPHKSALLTNMGLGVVNKQLPDKSALLTNMGLGIVNKQLPEKSALLTNMGLTNTLSKVSQIPNPIPGLDEMPDLVPIRLAKSMLRALQSSIPPLIYASEGVSLSHDTRQHSILSQMVDPGNTAHCTSIQSASHDSSNKTDVSCKEFNNSKMLNISLCIGLLNINSINQTKFNFIAKQLSLKQIMILAITELTQLNSGITNVLLNHEMFPILFLKNHRDRSRTNRSL